MSGRTTLKALMFALATVAVAPTLLSYWIRSQLLGVDRALEGSTQALSLVPGIIGQYMRRAFLARTLASSHWTATIEFGTVFSRAGARLESGVYVGPRCHLGLVHLEQDVLIGAGVHIPSGAATHGIDDLSTPIRDQPGRQRVVRVGAGSWIGSGAILLEDVGRQTVIGAGSLVTHPVGDRVIAAGVPAKVIRSRIGSESALAESPTRGSPA